MYFCIFTVQINTQSRNSRNHCDGDKCKDQRVLDEALAALLTH